MAAKKKASKGKPVTGPVSQVDKVGKADKASKTGKEKAKPKAHAGHAAKKETTLPLYLVVLLVLAALAFGYLVKTVIQPVPQGLEVVPGAGTGQEPGTPVGILRPVDVLFLQSSQCAICEDRHTMLEFFDDKGIKYDLEKVDAESERGKALATEYNVKEVPTLLVKAEDLRQHKELTGNFERFFVLKNDRFVVVEPDLDKIVHPKYFLAAPDESCLLTQKTQVFVFDDPYCPSCLMNRLHLNEMRNQFGDQAEFIYSYIPTDSKKLIAQSGPEDAERAARYLACAQLQGKISELDTQLTNLLCDITNDGTATPPEIFACQNSSKLTTPLKLADLDKAAAKAGLDMNVLKECEPTAKIQFDKAFSRSLAYNVRQTPLAVVDCRYVVHVADLQKGLCQVFPDNEACKIKEE